MSRKLLPSLRLSRNSSTSVLPKWRRQTFSMSIAAGIVGALLLVTEGGTMALVAEEGQKARAWR